MDGEVSHHETSSPISYDKLPIRIGFDGGYVDEV